MEGEAEQDSGSLMPSPLTARDDAQISRSSHQRSKWLDRALTFLCWNQHGDGEVPVYVSSERTMSEQGRFDSNVFGTAIVLHAVRSVRDHRAARVRRRAASFLLRWRESDGLWRFWTPKADRRIDPDVDVIAVVAAALREHDPALDAIVPYERIMECRDRNGLFKTWVREASATNDVDAVVNANVLWCVGRRDGTARAQEFVIECLRSPSPEVVHPYYDKVTSLCYAAARALGTDGLPEAAGQMIVDRLEEFWRDEPSADVADLAMSIAALRSVDAKSRRRCAGLIERLAPMQREQGEWGRSPMWNGPEWPAPRALWWGSECLSTAIAIEALYDSRRAS